MYLIPVEYKEYLEEEEEIPQTPMQMSASLKSFPISEMERIARYLKQNRRDLEELNNKPMAIDEGDILRRADAAREIT